MKDGTYYYEKLCREQLAGIEALVANGSAKGVCYKLDPGFGSGIVCMAGGSVAGFMTFDCFGGSEVESAAVTKDAAVWAEMDTLLHTLAAERPGVSSILYICSPADKAVSSILADRGLAPTFSEYRMTLNPEAFLAGAPVDDGRITLICAGASDADYIHRLDADAFGGQLPSPEEVSATFLILCDGRRAGKLRLDRTGDTCGIYGVVVEPELRGQGIGGQAMTLLLAQLVVAVPRVYLEVESRNQPAFHLYKKLGFVVETEFAYYPSPISAL